MAFGNSGSVGNGKSTRKINFYVLKKTHSENTHVKEIASKTIKQAFLRKNV